ncbi:MAG: hypothetical protein DMG06_03560, partial [Acidobacteria bacterium]
VAYALEGDESPHACVLADFLDDTDAFLEGHLVAPAFGYLIRMDTRKVLGVYFCKITDTKRLIYFLSDCK